MSPSSRVGGIEDLVAEVEAGPQGPEVGAFFDFDGTLIDGYSGVIAFRERLTGGQVGPEELVRTLIESFNVSQRGHDVSRLMNVAIGSMTGREVAEIDDLSQELWRSRIAGKVYPDARRLVAAHHRAGHTVAMASSATRFQAADAARDLDIEHVLVTELEDEEGILTGQVRGPILWGPGKAQAVVDFAAANGVDLTESYAYGNGREDVPYLETVGRPRPLNPDVGLTAEAEERGWPVQRLQRLNRLTPVTVARTAASMAGLGIGVGAGLAAGLLNQDRRTALTVAAAVASELSLAAAGVKIDVIGQENLWSHRPAVFLFNHQSQLDVPVLGSLLRRDFTAVAKKELATDPVFAPMGWLADVAYVDRTDGRKAREALAPAVDALRSGTSLVIAPEGTRSPTPKLLPFKKGAFHLALQAKVPIVPIVIRNAGEIMAPRGVLISSGTVDVAVLDPIDTSRWTLKTLGTKVDQVRQRYLDTLADWPRG
jgi:putative phosphoserine phosphatase/1-acylglycerol-3-phosphate O-acyltransferase